MWQELLKVRDKVKTVRKLDWFDFVNPQYVTLRLTPDSSVRNHRTEELVRTICDQFKLPVDRIIRQGLRITGYKLRECASFEIYFKNNKVHFHINVPKDLQVLMERRLSSIWDKSTVEVIDNVHLTNEHFDVYEMVYDKHDIYSLHTDAKDNAPLGSLLEAGKLVEDEAIVFVHLDPINQLSWQMDAKSAWKKLRDGTSPRKFTSSFRNVLFALAAGMSKAMSEIMDTISNGQSVYSKQVTDPEASSMAISNLTNSTRQKMSKPAIKTSIWIAATNDIVAKTVGAAFADLASDNQLVARKVTHKLKKQAILSSINTKQVPKIKLNFNVMSSAEASKLVQLPGRELQDMFPYVERVDTKQTEVPKELVNGGLLIGSTTYRGETTNVYTPINDYDELCLPRVVIGGMGQGKTMGYGANFIVESVRNGFGCLAVDAARRQIGDEVEKCLPADKILRIDLSKEVYALDWIEAQYDERAKARLAGIAMSFFNASAEETGGQTERFIRAAVMGMKTGRLSEIMQIFENDIYLEEVIDKMPDGLNKTTLVQFLGFSPSKRDQILSPIYNRLNVILSDPHLSKCFESTNSLDLVEIMTQKKAVIIDVPDDGLDKTAIDIMVNLISSKIDIAMRLRAKVKGTESEFPFFVLLDEPHKYGKSSKIWESAVVESRKWRVGYIWMFHYWEQVPTQLQKAIKNALPHYYIYPTSKKTWEGFKEEIQPFEIEDALKLKRFHAINIIRAGGETLKPFVVRMAKPPSS